MAELKKSLGFTALLFYGIGMILGAGIYSVIGPAVAEAHEAIWMSFLGAALVALLTGLSYAELSTRIPEAGAEYSYMQKAFPNKHLLGFITGIIVCMLGAATAATVALSFAGYLQGFIELPRGPVALGLLLLVTLVNIIGIQLSSKMNILFTLIELSGLVIVITLGWQKGTMTEEISLTPSAGVLPAAALLFFSYLGFENMAALSEEAREPRRHLPWAIIISVVATTIVYLLVGFATLALVSPESLAQDEAPLTRVVAAGSQRLVPIVQGIALFATANTALIAILSASRVAFSMARKGDLPQKMKELATRNGSPWIATLVIFTLAAILLPLGKVEVVAQLASFLSLLTFAAVHMALIRLRFSHSQAGDSFRVPGHIGKVPLLPVFGLVAIVFMMFQFSGKVYGLGGLSLLLAAGLYLALGRSTAVRDAPRIPSR